MKKILHIRTFHGFKFKGKGVFVISLFGIIFLEVIILIFGPFSFSEGKFLAPREGILQDYADDILGKCSSFGYRPSCYDKEIPKLMSVMSMEEAFEVTRLVTDQDHDYLHCHVLAHSLAAEETAKDPSKWKDVVARCPTAICNNGCPHGALMEAFQSESEFLSAEQIEYIKPDLADACEPREAWSPTEVERSMCYHGLGHLNMYITNADINKSIEICKEIGVKSDGRNYVQTCTEGVFMSIFQPLDPEDFALVAGITPTKEETSSFCSVYSGEAFDACHRETWPLFRKEIGQSEGLTRFCSYTEDFVAQKKCYASLMNSITLSYVVEGKSLDKLTNFCSGLSGDWTGFCFTHAARRLIQIDPRYTDRAVEVCMTAEKIGAEEGCYELMAAMGSRSFLSGSGDLEQYCRTLPKEWNGKCLKGTNFSGSVRTVK